jgi:hypothetical protein
MVFYSLIYAGSCEYGDEPVGSTKVRGFLDYLSDY